MRDAVEAVDVVAVLDCSVHVAAPARPVVVGAVVAAVGGVAVGAVVAIVGAAAVGGVAVGVVAAAVGACYRLPVGGSRR